MNNRHDGMTLQGANRQITLNFDEKLLMNDAVQVWPTSPDTEGLAMVTMCECQPTTSG